MEEVLIKNKKYYFIKAFKDNEFLRKSYNTLTKKTYGFDFEQWYENGYWGDDYIPYSLIDNDNIVANVSISIINYLVLGQHKKYIQIGTVMTDSNYRNKGLARYLLKRVIEEWNNKCDMVYLFANNKVLDFYPKFGFKAIKEYGYSIEISNNSNGIAAEKLDMSLDSNRALVVNSVNNTNPIAKISMLKNSELIMFYCLSFMSNNVYYLKEQDTIVIAEFKKDTLCIYDIFSTTEVNLDTIVKSLANKEIKTVILGFTPNNIENYNVNLLHDEDTTLFVMEDKEELFKNNKLMFPVLSHA